MTSKEQTEQLWEKTILHLQNQNPEYSVIFYNTKADLDNDANELTIRFRPENKFAFKAATQNEEIRRELEKAILKIFNTAPKLKIVKPASDTSCEDVFNQPTTEDSHEAQQQGCQMSCKNCTHYFSQPNTNDIGFCEQQKTFVDGETLACTYYEANIDEGVLGTIKNETKVAPKDLKGLTVKQQEFLDLVDSGVNVYLAGVGGTGKSYVLEKLIEECKKTGKQVIACAPTGIAALNIGGSTIHRTLKIKPEDTLETTPIYRVSEKSPIYKCDLLIVDEISMCRLDLFDYLSQYLKTISRLRRQKQKTPIQLVVVGDFSQLPPVVRDADRMALEQKYGFDIGGGYAFMGNEWESWHFHKVELDEVIRQRDKDFATALEAVRRGEVEGLRWIEDHAAKRVKNPIYLCGKNRCADTRNRHALEKIDAPATSYEAVIEGDVNKSDMPTSTTLELKPGARVMSLINDQREAYMNGSLGTVVKCYPDKVIVEFDNGSLEEIEYYKWSITRPTLRPFILDENKTDRMSNDADKNKIEIEEVGSFTQLPLKLAYALTVHKSQGQTFDVVKIQPTCWDPGQLYTALSRAVSIEGLSLEKAIPDKSLVTSPDVIDFYAEKPIVHRPPTVPTEQMGLFY